MDSTLLLLIVIFGSLISSLTGLGGGSFILASLLLYFPPSLALPLHSFTQLIINILRSGLFFKSVLWNVVGFFSLLMLPGAWLAGKIFDQINPGFLKVIVGSLILISILPIQYAPRMVPGKKTFLFMGFFSGFVSMFIGTTGPMVMPFFNRLELSREEMLSTKSAGQSVLQLSKLISFWGATSIDFDPIDQDIPIILLSVLAGVLLSIPLGRKIPDPKFNMIINVMLMIIASKTLFVGINEIIN